MSEQKTEDKASEAWRQLSVAEGNLNAAARTRRKAQLMLIDIYKQESLDNLEEYPQHAETILNDLAVYVVNLLT